MRVGRGLMVAAAVVGLVHAAFSLYWAVGGRALLGTVGQWAVSLVEQTPVLAGVALAGIAVIKTAGAVIPVLVEDGRVRPRRAWRKLETIGAILLTLYGLFNLGVSNAVLAGLIATPYGYDRQAQIGHAALWDPLFFLWGALLLAGLALTRRQPAVVATG